MVPEILIVGDEVRRVELGRRVKALGYDAAQSSPDDLAARLESGPAPAAIVVCTGEVEAPLVMAELRRSRRGAAVPVTLCGRLGGAVRDLADVLDLGADHFLEEPVGDDQLTAALEALAGPPMHAPSVSAEQAAGPSEDTNFPSRTEVLSEEESAGVAGGSSPDAGTAHRGADPVIGRLHRTLDLLEERLRSRENRPGAGDGGDALEQSLLELDPVPVDAQVEVPEPGDSQNSLEVLRLHAHGTGSGGLAGQVDNRESTVMLEAAAGILDPMPQREPSTPTGSWPEARSGPVTFDEVHEMSSARLLHDRPRRAAPLPVEHEGTLDRVEVPRLIWKLHRAGYTGRLSLKLGRVEKRVWFEGGQITFARSNVGHDRLNDGLLRRGLLTRTQYETARRLAAKEPRRAGQLLVESGFLKPDELPRVLREHLGRIVDSTFPWNDGAWTLVPAELCEEAVKLDQAVPVLIIEGIRHRMEAAQLWALIGGPRQYPCLRERAAARAAELVESLLMSPSEEAWMLRLDGQQSLEQLTGDPSDDELELLGLVYGLHVLELVDVLGEPRPSPHVTVDASEVDRQRITERVALSREADYFAFLGLSRDATTADVRRACADLRKTFDDRSLEAVTRDTMVVEIEEIRTALSEAKKVLGDDALRNAYLAHLEEP